jgi:Trypsin/PEP-CTERM motif
MNRHTFALGALALAAATAAQAAPDRVASGTHNGISWQAQSLIVGQNSTDLLSAGGNPVYTAPMPQYNGVVSLILTYAGVGSFICTGTLLPDRQSVLTAAHCVTDGPTLANPTSATAYFYGGPDPDTRVHSSPSSTPVSAAQYFVNPGYTGEVIDQNDIAVIRLSTVAPSWAQSYQLSTVSDLTGSGFNVAGYGRRSSVGGAAGANVTTGYLRQGDNRYDFRFGDSDFCAGYWDGVFGNADVTYSYVSDFDNGTAARDATALLAADPDFNLSGPKWENWGVGQTEVGVAGGDSGGPQFIGGRIASVTSYGLSFGTAYGDIDGALNSSFGEFSGYVPVYIHNAWINAQLVPEPGTYAMMALGLAAVGLAARRRRAD